MINFYSIFFVSLLFKLIVCYFLPLSFDEAYYWVWSHHPQLSYYDHPGFVSWLFYLGHPLEGWGQAVRFPAILFGHLYLLIWFYILKPYFNDQQIKFWFLFCLLSPLLGLGLTIITPDVPLLIFWSLSVLFFLRSINQPTALNYSLLGASLGLGLCSKYHIVVFLFSIFTAFLVKKDFRKKISWSLIGFTFLFGLIFSFPVLYWNYLNNYISFKFQLNHGLSHKESWSPSWSLEYIFGQIFFLFLPVFWSALTSREKNLSNSYFFKFFAWVPLGFFLLSSFKSTTEPNWPTVGHLSLFAIILNHKNLSQLFKKYLYYWLILYGVAFTALINNDWKWADKLREPFYYDKIYSLVEQYSPLYTESYQMASKLSFYYKKPFYKLRGMSRIDFYDFLEESLPTHFPFFLLKEENHDLPDWIRNEKYAVKKIKTIQDKFEVLEISMK